MLRGHRFSMRPSLQQNYRCARVHHGHDRILRRSWLTLGVIVCLLLFILPDREPTSNTVFAITLEYEPLLHETSLNIDSVVRKSRWEQEELKSMGRGAAAGGGDNNDKEQLDKNHDNNEDQQKHVTSYAQRHPNYYYTNGNRVSSSTKSAYSYYDYNDDDSYYSRSNNSNRERNNLYTYTTKLSDVYWCLLIALGWSIWMIHSIALLRQQHYNTMMSITERGTTTMMHTPTVDTMRIFRTNYTSLLLVRGHVLDIIPNPIIATDTPIVTAPTSTVIIDYIVERQQQQQQQQQQQPLLSPTTTVTGKDDNVTTLPTIGCDTVLPNEYIQIRKHFETTQPNLEVGFGNVELLVLPNDPMCSILKYDYDDYLRQEERIQRVIVQEQYHRDERRKKRHRPRREHRLSDRQINEDSMLPQAIILDHEAANVGDLGGTSANPQMTRPNMKIDTDLYSTEKGYTEDDDDALMGCDMCCTGCDWNYDQYQWKRVSLFFAVLLVFASIFGTMHVVRRMDPKKEYLGWISFWTGLILLFPAAMWIHKVMIACHRWSESQPEKQGYIVQSSTITSRNNGELNEANGATTIPNVSPDQVNLLTLADACMKPSCTDMMNDMCDPNCSNHTIIPSQHTSRTNHTSAEFSYVVPEMSGCYFIHYPKKDHYHHRHDKSTGSTGITMMKKHLRKSKKQQTHISRYGANQPDQNKNLIVEQTPKTVPTTPTLQNVVDTEDVITKTNGLDQDDDTRSDDRPPVADTNDDEQRNVDDSSSSSSCIIESESSVSSISSNDDPTMQRLSIWNGMIHDI